jgi:hypothetical protein
MRESDGSDVSQSARSRSGTFAERLDGVATPFARVTDQVQALIDATGHAAGGLPGEKLLRRVGAPIHPAPSEAAGGR